MKSYIGNSLNDSISEAQEMWVDIIISVVTQKKFNIEIGNMDYVLGNMIAKLVSSSKYYKITEHALNYIHSIGINSKEPLHVKKFIYGKEKNTILEHIIPASVIKKAVVENRHDSDEIKRILSNSGFVIIATRAEDELLKNAKLSSKMPATWTGFGDKPEKRYESVGIEISNTLIEHEGPICR